MPFVAAIAGAALASSFAAPAIIGAVGATSAFATTAITVGTAAAGGALGSSLAGGSARQGALIGAGVGLVGPALGVGPQNTLFGGSGPLFGSTATQVSGPAMSGLAATAPPASPLAAGAVAPAAAAAAAPAGGLLGGLSGSLGQALTMMAMSTFGRAPQDLTEPELEALKEQARRQGIEENVFNQAFEQARMVAQRAVPDTEGAFARQQIASARAMEEDVRGAPTAQRDAARRRAQLGGLRTAAGATAAEQSRADSAAADASRAFAGLRPPSQSAAEMSLDIYGDLYRRRQDYAADLARGVGTLFA